MAIYLFSLNSMLIIICMYDESAATTFQARIDDISNSPNIWKAVYANSDAIF